MRLMVLKAAKAIDVLNDKKARAWAYTVQPMVPERIAKIIYQAIQMHGATGISEWTDVSGMRVLRFADGPDEVHRMMVGQHDQSVPLNTGVSTAIEINSEPVRQTFDASKAVWGPKHSHNVDVRSPSVTGRTSSVWMPPTA